MTYGSRLSYGTRRALPAPRKPALGVPLGALTLFNLAGFLALLAFVGWVYVQAFAHG